MDAFDGDTGAERAAAQPADPEPAASQPGAPPAGAAASQPGDAALAVAQAALPGDVELAATIRSVDEGQVQEGVPLTVLVGGTLLVGELVSAVEWWKEAARLARGAGGDANTQFADGADVVSELSRQAVIVEGRPVGYLHMRNAAMESGRRIELLRIRLAEVQAWAWGPSYAT